MNRVLGINGEAVVSLTASEEVKTLAEVQSFDSWRRDGNNPFCARLRARHIDWRKRWLAPSTAVKFEATAWSPPESSDGAARVMLTIRTEHVRANHPTIGVRAVG